MALGEAALMYQSSMCLAVWCALFGLPSLYLQCRHILDLLVEEALQLVAAFLRAGLHPPLPTRLPKAASWCWQILHSPVIKLGHASLCSNRAGDVPISLLQAG